MCGRRPQHQRAEGKVTAAAGPERLRSPRARGRQRRGAPIVRKLRTPLAAAIRMRLRFINHKAMPGHLQSVLI